MIRERLVLFLRTSRIKYLLAPVRIPAWDDLGLERKLS